MEGTLAYLTGNDPRLADDLISALSSLFIAFFSAEMEDERHGAESEQITESKVEPPEQRRSDLCPPIDDGAGAVQSGEHAETVRPAGESPVSRMAGRKNSGHRRGSWDIRFGPLKAPRLRPTRNPRFPWRGRRGVRAGDFPVGPLLRPAPPRT